MFYRLFFMVCLLGLNGCTSVTPHLYTELESSTYLRQDSKDGHMPYSYASVHDFRNYKNMIIKPVVVYEGKDHHFGEMENQDRAALAKYMQTTFAGKLGTRFMLVETPGQDTLELRLTLTGADTNTPILATLSRFDVAGGIYNGIQAGTGGEGTFTGYVLYAVELFDSSSSRLLAAYVTKQYPNAWNLGATTGRLAAAEAGLDNGADALLAYLE